MYSTQNDNANYLTYAQRYLVGGVSSSFRINPYTNRPIYLSRADGPYIFDLVGQKYIDFFMGHGACSLGHNRPEIRSALLDVIDGGFFAEFDNTLSVELAKKIIKYVPCAERVRFVNSGTEGTLLAIRLARGYSGRTKIVRVDGHFHGVHDYVLGNNLASKIDYENPGSRVSLIGNLTAGIPETIRETLFIIPWNHPEVFENLARENGHEIAAIMMNPIDFNNGCIETTTEYLQAIRDICDQHGIILIFDEILSGFRTGLSCAQGYYNVTPDMCLLGKALTNGVPLAVIAGKEEIMMKIMDPIDPVVAGGTFSGNKLGCAAGLAVVSIMERPGFFEKWLSHTGKFMNILQDIFIEENFPAHIQHLGCNFFIYVGTREPIRNYKDFIKLDSKLAIKFFCKCIEKGLYFHTDFTVSAMHDENTLSKAADIIHAVVQETNKEVFNGNFG